MIDCQKVVEVFLSHCDKLGNKISKIDFEKNLLEKISNEDFQNDVVPLLIDGKSWSTDLAHEMVNDRERIYETFWISD